MASLLLTIDTALGETYLGVFRGEEPLTLFSEMNFKQQSTSLLTWIEKTLADAGVEYPELSAIAVATGPGGFTSIRIGLATARALAFALNIPVHGFTTLQLMAEAARETIPPATPFGCLLPSGMEQYFFQAFRHDGEHTEPLAEACLLTTDMLKESLAAYAYVTACRVPETVQGAIPTHWLTHLPATHPAMLARCMARVGAGETTPPAPVYVRPPDAKLPSPRA